jgi:hypothetical protein
MRRSLFATTGAVALLWAGAAGAQEAQQQVQQPVQPMVGDQPIAVAEQCMMDLQAFTQELAQAGYGMVGPPGYGITEPATGWHGTLGPRREMHAVVMAAQILARHGREEACQTVLEEARSLHQERMAQLEEAAVPPDEVFTWRHEQMLTAIPVQELDTPISIDSVINADVRNLRDEHLGDVTDVILAEDGSIEYVLLARGGFFGLGEEHVPVRWDALQVVPMLDTFVLDVPQEVVDQAPRMEREVFADLPQYDQQRQQVDTYWQEHAAG